MNESWIPVFIDWAIPVMLLLSAIYTGSVPVMEKIKLHQYLKMLRQLSVESMHDVVIENDVEDYIHIDHLLLLPNGIYVMQTMNFPGTIFAGESIDLWTQVLGKRSFKFPNPLSQLDDIAGSIKAIADTKYVSTWLVFSDECRFPKGKPERVSTVRELKNDLAGLIEGQVSPALNQSWQRLREATRGPEKIHGNKLFANKGGNPNAGRLKTAGTLLLFSLVWVIWRTIGQGM